MKKIAFLFIGVLALGASGFEVQQLFRPERATRGNVNLLVQQAADKADWIWLDGAAPASNAVDVVRFACTFTATTAPLVFDVSADERFVLLLDGQEIARGPHKGCVNHWYYESYSVTGLSVGDHRLEAVVVHFGEGRPRAVLTAGSGAFLLKAEGVYDGRLSTGRAKWRAARVRGTHRNGYGDSATFGGSQQFVVSGTGFLDPSAAEGFGGVKVVQHHIRDTSSVRADGRMLFPTERPDQMMAVRRPGAFKAGQPLYRADTNVYYSAADAAFPLVAEMNALLKEGRALVIPAGTTARLVWDLGDYYCGYPRLAAAGGAGAEVRWGWGESLYDRHHQRADRNAFADKRCAHALRDTFRLDGRPSANFSVPWWRCGRWCEFEVKTADAPLTLTALDFVEVRYPLAEQASFACDDASIAGIWTLCRRGLENCMHETYMDCPYFEQQMYPGDTRVVMLIANALSGDARLNRFAAGIFDYARREDGFVPMNYPCYLMQESSTYSMCWVLMLGDYARWQGGDGWLKARLPGMRHTLHALANCRGDDGLLTGLPGWSFQDWVEGWDYGRAPGGRHGKSAVDNLLFVYTLAAAERVELLMGDRRMAAYWREMKKDLTAQILATYWDEGRGLIADTVAKNCFSEHAQCLALLSDVLPAAQEARVLKGLLEAPDLARTTVYFSHYLFDVYAKYGRTDLFLKRLDLWRGYVQTGLKTPLEAPGLRARSDCHAWGSHPIYHLLTGVAGIRPAADGFAAVLVKPQPGGLKWIKSAMPTPKGPVKVDLSFSDAVASGTVTIPEGLPAMFEWRGRRQILAAGVNRVDVR
ncbi:MAG: hypothetical protein MJ240_09925 [Kiritimatiellae bacterium]|nr:hypothetical protein [Kiritimatiellia bacterium]